MNIMKALASVLVVLTLAAWSGESPIPAAQHANTDARNPTKTPEARQAESPPSAGVDEEVYALVQELRDLPAGAPETREIYGRLTALGSAAVPALARMLQSSLQVSDKRLTDILFSSLSEVHGSYFREGNYEANDMSAALPVLMLALDDPTVRWRAARIIGTIGPKAAEAAPKLVAMLDDGGPLYGPECSALKSPCMLRLGQRLDACSGLTGIDALPALRQARSDPSAAKRQFAQHAVAEIEEKCFIEPLGHVGSSCDAPPYGDTPAAYEAFARPYVSISLGSVIPLLQQMCGLKSHPNGDRSHIGLRFPVSDEDLNTLSTVALVEQQLAKIVIPEPCPYGQGSITVINGKPCPQWQKGADAPADLFLCFEPDGNCQQIPATPSTPMKTLLECQGLVGFLLMNAHLERGAYRRYTDGRYPVRGAGAWYECRGIYYLDKFEPQVASYRLIPSDAVWVRIDSRFPLYVDTSSIAFRSDRRRAWFQTRFPPHSYRFDAEKYVIDESTMWDFSCASKDVRILGSDLTLDDGSTQRGAPNWTPVEVKPGTLVGLEMQYLCRLPPEAGT